MLFKLAGEIWTVVIITEEFNRKEWILPHVSTWGHQILQSILSHIPNLETLSSLHITVKIIIEVDTILLDREMKKWFIHFYLVRSTFQESNSKRSGHLKYVLLHPCCCSHCSLNYSSNLIKTLTASVILWNVLWY